MGLAGGERPVCSVLTGKRERRQMRRLRTLTTGEGRWDADPAGLRPDSRVLASSQRLPREASLGRGRARRGRTLFREQAQLGQDAGHVVVVGTAADPTIVEFEHGGDADSDDGLPRLGVGSR
jgi:hypothetical protein